MRSCHFIPLGLALLLATTAQGQAAIFQVDRSSTRLIWAGKKVGGGHQGTVKVSSGTVAWGSNGLEHAELTIDMKSISNTDLGKEYAPRLENHLKSEDFFDAKAFPTASFRTTRVEKIPGVPPGQPNYAVTGDLTIKGITKPVTFNVLAWQDKKKVRAAGKMVFDRTAYDVKYRSGKFFEALGDKLIDDSVEITFDLEGK